MYGMVAVIAESCRLQHEVCVKTRCRETSKRFLSLDSLFQLTCA